MTLPDPSVSFDAGATMRAARILIARAPGPATRLDAFLLLAGQEHLWRRDGSGADFAEAVRRYEAAAGTTLARPMSPPSFGVVKWRGAERRHEVAVGLAGRFLGWLSSPSRRARPRACSTTPPIEPTPSTVTRTQTTARARRRACADPASRLRLAPGRTAESRSGAGPGRARNGRRGPLPPRPLIHPWRFA